MLEFECCSIKRDHSQAPNNNFELNVPLGPVELAKGEDAPCIGGCLLLEYTDAPNGTRLVSWLDNGNMVVTDNPGF